MDPVKVLLGLHFKLLQSLLKERKKKIARN